MTVFINTGDGIVAFSQKDEMGVLVDSREIIETGRGLTPTGSNGLFDANGRMYGSCLTALEI